MSNEIVLHRSEAMKLGRLAGKWTEKAKEMTGAGTALGAAAAAGFVRGKFERSDGSLPLPVVNADAEGVAGLALLLLGLSGLPEEVAKGSSYYVGQVGLGVSCHYLGQIARKSAKAGKFTAVAGDDLFGGGHEGISGEDALAAALRPIP
jgi:hypothetical protein